MQLQCAGARGGAVFDHNSLRRIHPCLRRTRARSLPRISSQFPMSGAPVPSTTADAGLVLPW